MKTITVNSAGFSPAGTNAVSTTETRSPVLKQKENDGPKSIKIEESRIEALNKPVKLTTKIGAIATAQKKRAKVAEKTRVRGRLRENLGVYSKKNANYIAQLERRLEIEKDTARQLKLRNRISARKSRIKSMREQHYLATLMTKRAGHTQILLDVLQEHLADMPDGEKLMADIAVQMAVNT